VILLGAHRLGLADLTMVRQGIITGVAVGLGLGGALLLRSPAGRELRSLLQLRSKARPKLRPAPALGEAKQREDLHDDQIILGCCHKGFP
jgi:hypothetical protein